MSAAGCLSAGRRRPRYGRRHGKCNGRARKHFCYSRAEILSLARLAGLESGARLIKRRALLHLRAPTARRTDRRADKPIESPDCDRPGRAEQSQLQSQSGQIIAPNSIAGRPARAVRATGERRLIDRARDDLPGAAADSIGAATAVAMIAVTNNRALSQAARRAPGRPGAAAGRSQWPAMRLACCCCLLLAVACWGVTCATLGQVPACPLLLLLLLLGGRWCRRSSVR